MTTAGIIAEYNPFHNGHKYHIEETRRQTGADYIIAAISGDFVQRGAPALLNKYERAKMALDNGVDLVLELPVTTALSSAEGFAEGGVCLFHKLGIVDLISFGCETADDPELFQQTARILSDEPEEYREMLISHLKSGVSFPKAREMAVHSLLHKEADLLSRPNNILGLEYQKAIYRHHCSLSVCPILRQGNDYNSTSLSETMSSATAIRETLFSMPMNPQKELMTQVPDSVLPVLLEAQEKNQFLRERDLSDLLYYSLLQNRDHLSDYGPANPDLISRIQKLLEEYESWNQFISLLKSKNQTYTAISRCLAQILLGITRRDLTLASSLQYAPYARILGFRKDAAPLLQAIMKKSRLPVLKQLAKDRHTLDEKCRHLLALDLSASDIYNRILYTQSGEKYKSDLRQPLMIR